MTPKRPQKFTADRLPDIWAVDTEFLLTELARIRDLALHVPTNTTDPLALHLPINTVIDALWNLEKDMRYCLKLQREMQQSFAQKAETSSQTIKQQESNRSTVVRMSRIVIIFGQSSLQGAPPFGGSLPDQK